MMLCLVRACQVGNFDPSASKSPMGYLDRGRKVARCQLLAVSSSSWVEDLRQYNFTAALFFHSMEHTTIPFIVHMLKVEVH